jgi:hypothetical protein
LQVYLGLRWLVAAAWAIGGRERIAAHPSWRVVEDELDAQEEDVLIWKSETVRSSVCIVGKESGEVC